MIGFYKKKQCKTGLATNWKKSSSDNPNSKDFVYFQGCDPEVSFISEYNPNNGIISVLVSNYGDNVWMEMRKIREVLY